MKISTRFPSVLITILAVLMCMAVLVACDVENDDQKYADVAGIYKITIDENEGELKFDGELISMDVF